MDLDSNDDPMGVLGPLVEQYEYECLLSSRNATDDAADAPGDGTPLVCACVGSFVQVRRQ